MAEQFRFYCGGIFYYSAFASPSPILLLTCFLLVIYGILMINQVQSDFAVVQYSYIRYLPKQSSVALRFPYVPPSSLQPLSTTNPTPTIVEVFRKCIPEAPSQDSAGYNGCRSGHRSPCAPGANHGKADRARDGHMCHRSFGHRMVIGQRPQQR